jgi:hypothetical protein
MKVIQETETEMYIEVEQEELPLTIDSPGKKIFISLSKRTEESPWPKKPCIECGRGYKRQNKI